MRPLKWVMPNHRRGDVVAHINGQKRVLRLTLAALAQIEACYDDMDILALIRDFAAHGMTAKDADNIIRAALVGAGDAQAHAETLTLNGDDADAPTLAHDLLERAFRLTEAKK